MIVLVYHAEMNGRNLFEIYEGSMYACVLIFSFSRSPTSSYGGLVAAHQASNLSSRNFDPYPVNGYSGLAYSSYHYGVLGCTPLPCLCPYSQTPLPISDSRHQIPCHISITAVDMHARCRWLAWLTASTIPMRPLHHHQPSQRPSATIDSSHRSSHASSQGQSSRVKVGTVFDSGNVNSNSRDYRGVITNFDVLNENHPRSVPYDGSCGASLRT
ncbi:hypothetical protein FPV67DRAFT_50619 [Lyophyllum atratum]|nr:hypothetical protein FPV67DRAFT_50619 [Lyophyllum atratum]